MTAEDVVEGVADALHEGVDRLADALTADPVTAQLAADTLAGLRDVWAFARERMADPVARVVGGAAPALLRALSGVGVSRGR